MTPLPLENCGETKLYKNDFKESTICDQIIREMQFR